MRFYFFIIVKIAIIILNGTISTVLELIYSWRLSHSSTYIIASINYLILRNNVAFNKCILSKLKIFFFKSLASNYSNISLLNTDGQQLLTYSLNHPHTSRALNNSKAPKYERIWLWTINWGIIFNEESLFNYLGKSASSPLISTL